MKIILDIAVEDDNNYVKYDEIILQDEDEDKDQILLKIPSISQKKIYINKKQLKKAIDFLSSEEEEEDNN